MSRGEPGDGTQLPSGPGAASEMHLFPSGAQPQKTASSALGKDVSRGNLMILNSFPLSCHLSHIRVELTADPAIPLVCSRLLRGCPVSSRRKPPPPGCSGLLQASTWGWGARPCVPWTCGHSQGKLRFRVRVCWVLVFNLSFNCAFLSSSSRVG